MVTAREGADTGVGVMATEVGATAVAWAEAVLAAARAPLEVQVAELAGAAEKEATVEVAPAALGTRI